jgi:hypothetical protein
MRKKGISLLVAIAMILVLSIPATVFAETAVPTALPIFVWSKYREPLIKVI